MFASRSPANPASVCTTRLAMVIVHVDDAGRGSDRLRHLMRVVRRGDAGAARVHKPDIPGITGQTGVRPGLVVPDGYLPCGSVLLSIATTWS